MILLDNLKNILVIICFLIFLLQFLIKKRVISIGDNLLSLSYGGQINEKSQDEV